MNFSVFNQISRVVSGGQTGVERAALDWAIGRKIAHGGWCAHGRRAEDGRLNVRYQLLETVTDSDLAATQLNVTESDGTLIINTGELEDGALAARQIAEQAGKPCLVLQLEGIDLAPLVDAVAGWVKANAIATLNITGPQESERPRIYRLARLFLASV